MGEDDVAAAEAALGASFPASYRLKMSRDNGGSVIAGDDEFELFKFLDRSDRKRMARTAGSDIVRENSAARNWPGFPDDAVAIGENGAGDYLILWHREGSLSSEVHAWDHETGATTHVASDFADLIHDSWPIRSVACRREHNDRIHGRWSSSRWFAQPSHSNQRRRRWGRRG